METDILGEPYEQRTIELEADEEGDVVAVLVRRRATTPTRKAVLYLHGYVDYFFQRHLADFFVERGYDFYALDLRKHGRSLREHQSPNFMREAADYWPEIDEAVRIIREEDGHDVLLLNGHSTGGLYAALWAHRVRGQGLVQGVFLNSPFVEFPQPWIVRKALNPIVSAVARRTPYRVMPQKLGRTYGMSIHRDHHGEWEYDLAWKPLNGYPIFAGWVAGINRSQRELRRGLAIDVPVLVAFSTRSYRGRFTEAAHHADAVLNVAHMARHAPGVGKQVTVVRIEGGKHDLTLSPKAARELLFSELDRWLRSTLGVEAASDLG